MRVIAGLAAFLILFAGLSFLCVQSDFHRSVNQFESHATIISDDIWALNYPSAKAYLRLALERDKYKSLEVIDPDGRVYLKLKSAPLAGKDAFFSLLHLIPVKRLKTNIYHHKRCIGKLVAELNVRVVYPLINLLIFLLFLVLSGLFVINLFNNRRDLERQVRERTKNLQESERRFHDLVNLLPEMVWETDRQGNVTYANQMAHDRLGLDRRAGAEKTNWLSAIAPAERMEAAAYFQDVIRGCSPGLREFGARDTEGLKLPLLLRSATIVDDAQVVGARCVAVDITERLDLEEQLRRAQRMKAIGLMAGGVAHDLNNILSGIVTYPELLLLDLAEDSPLRPSIEMIRRSGIAAAEVVADLLTVARGAVANRQIVNPRTLIEEYLESAEYLQLQSYHPEVRVSVCLADDTDNISCSPIHLRKCLMNLVTNGAEVIEGAGRIRIAIASRELCAEEAAPLCLPAGKYTVITVADSGPGIAREDLAHIFEPFYTKKEMGRSGTGLGLTVVWNTMQEHDGTVKVRSCGEGTTFDLILPAVEGEEERDSGDEDHDWRVFRGDGEHLLVVDDEPRQREVAVRLLKKLGYSVDAVVSGEQAVDYMHRKSAELLILDMMMEPGQGGRATYEQILEVHPQQKAIIVSGFSENDDIRATLDMGAGAFVRKPYTIGQIGRAVFRELNGVKVAL